MRWKFRGIMIGVILVVMLCAIGVIASFSDIDMPVDIRKSLMMTLPIMVVTMVAIFIIFDIVIQRNIIKGMDQLRRDIHNIASGKLDFVSYVGGCPEYEQMSHDINTMMKTISRTTSMLTRVFETFDAPYAVFEYNDNSKSVMVTDRLAMLLGIAEDELQRMVNDKQLFRTRIAWITKYPIPGEQDVYRVNAGKTEFVRINIVEEKNSAFGMVADVTDDIRRKQVIIKERDYDPLTQIRNRLSFQRDVSKLLSDGNLSECAMIMIDLDKFKGINDTYGHAFGDEYLQRAANFMRRFCDQNCIVARRSGDEFYIFIHNQISRDNIRLLVDNFYRMLANEPIDFPDGQRRSIKMSMGVAWYQDGVNNFDAFLQCADDALYEAKESGRNTYGEKEMQVQEK